MIVQFNCLYSVQLYCPVAAPGSPLSGSPGGDCGTGAEGLGARRRGQCAPGGRSGSVCVGGMRSPLSTRQRFVDTHSHDEHQHQQHREDGPQCDCNTHKEDTHTHSLDYQESHYSIRWFSILVSSILFY